MQIPRARAMLRRMRPVGTAAELERRRRRAAGAARSRSAARWSATRRRSRTGSATAGPRLKKARRLNAYLVFLDESGFLLLPTVRRTWAPRGATPLLRHRYRRDKVSAISAVTVSPQRHRCGLYAHFHCDNISQVEVALFLCLLLRHLAGPIIVLWDGGAIHGGPAVEQVRARHPRLHA